jgi:Flp pilus assembly pilin Flp
MRNWECPGCSADLGDAIRVLRSLWCNEDGQDLLEYSLMLFLVAAISFVSLKGLANSISAIMNSVASSLTSTS